jgi:hypothetical protein
VQHEVKHRSRRNGHAHPRISLPTLRRNVPSEFAGANLDVCGHDQGIHEGAPQMQTQTTNQGDRMKFKRPPLTFDEIMDRAFQVLKVLIGLSILAAIWIVLYFIHVGYIH